MRPIFHWTVLLAVVTVVGWASDAPACKCMDYPSLNAAREGSAAVLSGRVVWIDEPPPRRKPGSSKLVTSTGDMLRYAVLPIAIWKGAVEDTLFVYSARSENTCGYEMSLLGEYLLYARSVDVPRVDPRNREWGGGKPEGQVLTVSLCGRNKLLPAAVTDIELLGTPIWRRKEE